MRTLTAADLCMMSSQEGLSSDHVRPDSSTAYETEKADGIASCLSWVLLGIIEHQIAFYQSSFDMFRAYRLIDYLLKMEIMYVSQVRSYQDMHNSNVWSGLRISGCLRLFFKEASLLHCASYCMVHILFIEKKPWAYHTVQRKISCIYKSWGLTNPVRIQECLND